MEARITITVNGVERDVVVDTRTTLLDALRDRLAVFSPKTGNDGYVDPSEFAEAAPTAGLTQTSVVSLGEWSGSRLVQPKARSGKRP